MRKKILALIMAGLLFVVPVATLAGGPGVVVVPEQSFLPDNSVLVGYSFLHHFYNSGWENDYRAKYGESPVNNYNGLTVGLNHMFNHWLGLGLSFSHYFRKGASGFDGRITGVDIDALMFYKIRQKIYFVGLIGAVIGFLNHKGDGRNPPDPPDNNTTFSEGDASPRVGAGFQYAFNHRVSFRALLTLSPFQDRADTDVSIGATGALVIALT